MKKIIFLDRVRQNTDRHFFDEMSGVEVLTAYSNADALRIHRKERADVIITELYGSGMNAQQFCSEIRQDAELREVSIIVCCRDNEIERREAEQCRANAVLVLPLSSRSLREKFRTFLRISSRSSFQARFSARRSGAPSNAIDCRTENISMTGMLIEASAELHRGDMLQCSLDLAPGRSFSMQAEVVRADRSHYGVRFFRLDPAAQRAIEALVGQGSPVS